MAEEIKQNVTDKPRERNTDLPAQAGGFRPVRKFGGRKQEANDGIDSKLLDLARVTRVTGGGKRMSFRAVVVAGDKKSKIGIGIDKGRDVSQAIEKATARAKKNMINIVIVDGTIPHQVEAKMGPARILLKPQKKGRGLVAGGAVRTICDLVGIKNISSKILSGSKNKLNNARATMEALRKLKVKS
jgi:small subunit ribosomal protein S5